MMILMMSCQHINGDQDVDWTTSESPWKIITMNCFLYSKRLFTSGYQGTMQLVRWVDVSNQNHPLNPTLDRLIDH
jgi:hypothetical protein